MLKAPSEYTEIIEIPSVVNASFAKYSFLTLVVETCKLTTVASALGVFAEELFNLTIVVSSASQASPNFNVSVHQDAVIALFSTTV